MRCRGYSIPLQRRITDFGAEKSFARAVRQLKEHYGLEVPESAVRHITQGHAVHMLRNADSVSGAGKATGVAQLIAQTDGSMIPKVEVDTQTEGDLRKTRQVGWKEARLSLVYEQGTLQPVFGATTGGPEQAGDQLAWCARRIGMDSQTQVHAVGDGAPWIADQMEYVFGAQGTYLIDLYHLCDYLAAASKSCASDSKGWYKTQKRRMKAGQFAEVLQALEPHQESPSVDDENAPVRAAYRYIRNRPDQFDYPRALQAGLPSGSGEIESAHQYIIQERLKIAGAWWKVDNAEKMLALRTTRANGDWENYWDSFKAA